MNCLASLLMCNHSSDGKILASSNPQRVSVGVFAVEWRVLKRYNTGNLIVRIMEPYGRLVTLV